MTQIMKNIILFLVIALLAGCEKKEGLDLKMRTVYTSIPDDGKKSATNSMTYYSTTEYYTQFGDFVGAITPLSVKARFNTIRFIDRLNTDHGMQTMLEIIGVNWPFDDVRRLADFTNGNTLEVEPEIYGNVDTDGWFVDENIRLKYLFILPQEFTLEFAIPDLLTNNFPIHPNVYSERNGNTIKCGIDFLLYPVQDNAYDIVHGISLNGFVFGETDITYLVRQDNIPDGDVAELITQAQPHTVVRSSRYVSPTLIPPSRGETKIITTTISFDSKNIIQQYAGADNIPNTWDDRIVFVPKFWERFNVVIEQN